MTLNWISESVELPQVAQEVLFATPRQSGEFWDVSVARLLVRHEGVAPMPVPVGSQWPSAYYWHRDHFGRDPCLVTGNGWWASMTALPLPPLASHKHIRGFDVIAQDGDAFIPQRGRT